MVRACCASVEYRDGHAAVACTLKAETFMLPFDVILLDIGGVLLTNGWDSRDRASVLERFELDRSEFEVRHRAVYDPWLVGAISAEAYLAHTVFYQERPFAPHEFFSAVCNQSNVLPQGAMGILQALAASDRYVLVAANNEARETNTYRFERFGLDKLFDVALSSCFLGLRKPNPAYFERALELLCASAGRILFIDDREENVAAAEAVGICAVRFVDEGQLRGRLEELGVVL
jgi:putative hydrolase of the HAD superfamily